MASVPIQETRLEVGEGEILARIERLEPRDKSLQLFLQPLSCLTWTGGGCVELRAPEGTRKAYPVASEGSAPYLELHVDSTSTHPVDLWLSGLRQPGERLVLRPSPRGFTLGEDPLHRNHVIVCTGVGVAACLGLLRELLPHKPLGRIVLLTAELPGSGQVLRDLLKNFPQLVWIPGSSSVLECMLVESLQRLEGWSLYAYCERDIVQAVRVEAVRIGLPRDRLQTLYPETVIPREVRTHTVLARLQRKPDLWQAVGGHAGLREILEAFYTRVNEDPDLGPLYQHFPRAQAIAQNAAFLAWVITGKGNSPSLFPSKSDFGTGLSETLFEHRETLLAQVLTAHGLSPSMRWHWSALNECFRLEVLQDPIGSHGMSTEHPEG